MPQISQSILLALFTGNFSRFFALLSQAIRNISSLKVFSSFWDFFVGLDRKIWKILKPAWDYVFEFWSGFNSTCKFPVNSLLPSSF